MRELLIKEVKSIIYNIINKIIKNIMRPKGN